MIQPDRVLPYSGHWLDRAGSLRSDPQWINAVLARPDAQVLALWRDQCLMRGPQAATLSVADAQAALATAGELVFLGLDGDAGIFAADLSALEEPHAFALSGASALREVRGLVGTLSRSEAAILAYARGILHWHGNQRFCGACGGDTEHRHGGHLRVCRRSGCGKLLFPRLEPAVIVLVEAPGMPRRCLLVRHKDRAAGVYSTLAGFVEVGESLEDAVRREVAEEAGIQVDTVTYQASQAWPFPAGLMIGFRARVVAGAIAVNGDELEEARWFTHAELGELMAARGGEHRLFNDDSIEKVLIESWMSESHPLENK